MKKIHFSLSVLIAVLTFNFTSCSMSANSLDDHAPRNAASPFQFNFERDIIDDYIREFTEEIRLYPRDVLAYYWRGVFYYARDEYDLAIADYNEALKIDPACAGAYLWRGLSYTGKDDSDLAIADWNEAIRLSSDYMCTYYAYRWRGWVYINCKGDYGRGEADYAKAREIERGGRLARLNEDIRRDPNNADHYANRGEFHADNGDYDRAIMDYNTALRVDPTAEYVYSSRGRAYAKKGDHERSEADFAKAREVWYRHPVTRDLR